MSSFDELLVPDGRTLGVAVSSLIKSLRRGREMEALYWARQIEQGGFPAYLWRRLLIFGSEDVSIANPDAVVQVRALYDNYETLKAHGPRIDRSVLTMAVMVLARSPKSRECDDLLNVLMHLENRGYRPRVRDEAYDLHTPEGRQRWPRRYRMRQWLESSSREADRVGPRDWHLWLLRWAAQRGLYTIEYVDRVSQSMEERGLLRYGPDGEDGTQIDWRATQPEFERLDPASPKLDEDGWPPDAWQWACQNCGTVLTSCLCHDCCEHCTHTLAGAAMDWTD